MRSTLKPYPITVQLGTAKCAPMRAAGLALGLVLPLASILQAGPAAAADLLSAPVALALAPVPVPGVGGWYLRADATVSHFNEPKDATPADPADPGMPPLVGLRLSREAGGGGGVGYQVNGFLRVDATVDQRAPSRFRAYSSRSNFATGYNVEGGELSVLTAMFNVYADLGTWWGLTPYLGGGIGLAENVVRRGYTQTTCLIEECDGAPGAGPRTGVARPNHGFASFAWNLTAGLSYEVLPGVSIDTAYRYVDLGGAKSGVDAFGAGTRLKDITANEFRIGLRYRFAGGLLPFGYSNPYGH